MNIRRNLLATVAVILPLLLVFVLTGCEKPQGENNTDKGDSPQISDVSVSVDFKSSTATTATLSCDIMCEMDASIPVEVRLRYSLSESMSGDNIRSVTLKKDQKEVTLTGLVFDRQYYFESYVEIYGTEYNPQKSSFRTKNVVMTLNEPELADSFVTFKGKVEGYEQADSREIALELFLKDPSDPTLTENTHLLEIDETGGFELELSGFDISTRYNYWSRIRQGDIKSVEGDVRTFITSDPYASAVKDLSAMSATDLSASGTANCYIVPASGVYRFKTVKGNSSTTVGAVASVKILWESFGTVETPAPMSLISGTGYKDGYGYIEIPAAYKEGNAVVAAYDNSGKILWSWHIWLTDDAIVEHNYANNAGVMMDRNLGALSAQVNSVGALGLFYQWGRKDPFLGSSSIATPVYARSTRFLKVIVNTDATSNVDFAVANPHKFILGNQNGDWLSAKDNTLWTSSKTVYDPCPVGWRVPDGGYNGGVAGGALADGIWAKAGFTRQGKTDFVAGDEGKIGKLFPASLTGMSAWYPAAGCITYNDGSLSGLATDGVYYSVTSFGGNDTSVTGFLFNYLPVLQAHYIYCGGEKMVRAGGNSVRCCKE